MIYLNYTCFSNTNCIIEECSTDSNKSISIRLNFTMTNELLKKMSYFSDSGLSFQKKEEDRTQFYVPKSESVTLYPTWDHLVSI